MEWSRQLAESETMIRRNLLQKLDMEFTPHNIVFLPDQKHMVVGDCFGGNLMLFDIEHAVQM